MVAPRFDNIIMRSFQTCRNSALRQYFIPPKSAKCHMSTIFVIHTWISLRYNACHTRRGNAERCANAQKLEHHKPWCNQRGGYRRRQFRRKTGKGVHMPINDVSSNSNVWRGRVRVRQRRPRIHLGINLRIQQCSTTSYVYTYSNARAPCGARVCRRRPLKWRTKHMIRLHIHKTKPTYIHKFIYIYVIVYISLYYIYIYIHTNRERMNEWERERIH